MLFILELTPKEVIWIYYKEYDQFINKNNRKICYLQITSLNDLSFNKRNIILLKCQIKSNLLSIFQKT